MKLGKKVILLLAAVACLTGCFEELKSICPYYTSKDLVFDPALLGKWADSTSTNEPRECIEFKAFEKDAYLLGIPDSGTNANWFLAHLFEIKGQRFIDFQPTNDFAGFIPEHSLWKIKRTSSHLEIAWFSGGDLAQQIRSNTVAIQHALIRDNPEDPPTNGRVVLTAEAPELQKFILKYCGDTNVFVPVASLQKQD